MTAETPEEDRRINELRRLLEAEDAPGPPDAAWCRLALAGLLVVRGEREQNVGDIEAAIEHGRTGLAELTPPVDGPDDDFALAFHNLGVGHYLRAQLVPTDAREDLRLAAEAYQRSIALLHDSDPAVGGVTARLGVALAMAVQLDVLQLDDMGSWNQREWDAVDERLTVAFGTLETGRRTMHADDPFEVLARYWDAMMRAIRCIYFGGRAEDSEAALTDLEAIPELPECPTSMANACHAFSALLQFYRSIPEVFRQRGRTPSLANFARIMTTGNVGDPEAARMALAHLDRITEPDDATASAVGGLRAMLKAAGMDSAAGTLSQLASAFEDIDDAEDRELRFVQRILHSVSAMRSGRPEDLDTAAETLRGIVENLGDGHPVRDALRGVLGQFIDMAAGKFPGYRSTSPEEREAALELLEQTLRGLPDDHPDRASTLNRLVGTLAHGVEHKYSRERVRRVRTLVLEAIERPAADQENEAVNHFLLVLLDGLQSLFGGEDTRRLDDAIERLKRVLTLLPAEHTLRQRSTGLLAVLLTQRFSRAGALEDLEAAGYYARGSEVVEAGDVLAGDSDVAIKWLLTALPAIRGVGWLDPSRLEEVTESLTALAAQLPADHPLRGRLESDFHTFDFLRGVFGPDGPDPHALRADPERFAKTIESMVGNARALHRDSPLFPAEMGAAANARIGHGFVRRDLGAIDDGLVMLGDAYAAADAMSPLRPWLQGVIGLGLFMRYELSRDRADLSNAIDRLEEARRGVEAEPLASMTAPALGALAMAYHMRGDKSLGDQRRAAEAGLACLRARAWVVMLQSSTEHAFDAAVAAAGEAAEVGLRCVAGGLTDTAVEALEWGRAMVLHTATTDTSLPALLREDHPDLAAEWEAAPAETASDQWAGAPSPADLTEGRLPSDLRARVMAAVEGTEIERKLFSPAVPEEIAAVLRDAKAAALAYLVPHEDGRGGLALVVGADGETRRVRLPGLATGPNSRAEAFVQAQRDRAYADRKTREGERIHRRWRYALGDLCDWAWSAAMEPLLDTIEGTRVPRLILVPVGELGAIPWHAARHAVGDGVRYACQDAMISYAASARQFIDARRHGHRPWSSAAALVRAGGSDLYWASKEIELIHRHYPDGRLLGGRRRRGARRSPPATPGNVLGLLPGPHSAGASLLHLGCHANSAPRPIDSHLKLAGDDTLDMTDSSSILRMTDILRQARARPPGEPGGLVVLAACGSDLTGRHHDEALTLATAFLAAGAVGVVGTRWPVDDHPSSLFMTMFHQYLNAGYDDPAVALRATQLWMLNPHRTAPPDLADEPGHASLEEPESWAAFTYQGR